MKAFKNDSFTTVRQEMERWNSKAKPQTWTLPIVVPLLIPVPAGFQLGHMSWRVSEPTLQRVLERQLKKAYCQEALIHCDWWSPLCWKRKGP